MDVLSLSVYVYYRYTCEEMGVLLILYLPLIVCYFPFYKSGLLGYARWFNPGRWSSSALVGMLIIFAWKMSVNVKCVTSQWCRHVFRHFWSFWYAWFFCVPKSTSWGVQIFCRYHKNEMRYGIFNFEKYLCKLRGLGSHSAIASWINSYLNNVMTKFMINNRTDAWKTDVNLLNLP